MWFCARLSTINQETHLAEPVEGGCLASFLNFGCEYAPHILASKKLNKRKWLHLIGQS